MYSIAIYLCDLAYGGPEEGGWWYTYGEPVLEKKIPTPKFSSSRNELRSLYWDEMQQAVDELNKNRRPMSSVLSTGEYRVRIQKGMPKAFPDEIPHYE